ncbi:hypothetical protein BS50DRAFT_50054 [Corynespora cassiicola Philippines]|uniref:Uncharacterized protein n=1 Tax=Corynespora cassiicola Philippines TaxID=1448308 RepID=A0A2T2NHZ2_CORCC|nr:hypothetical protein BS50DRAFT_50054 [Corynespora cassiicola Philippines]
MARFCEGGGGARRPSCQPGAILVCCLCCAACYWPVYSHTVRGWAQQLSWMDPEQRRAARCVLRDLLAFLVLSISTIPGAVPFPRTSCSQQQTAVLWERLR